MKRPGLVDTHVHFYDMRVPTLRYEWLEPNAPVDPVVGDDYAIRAVRYWADDFLAETRFQGVEKVIHVQAAIGTPDPVDETRWLRGFADRLGAPHGIVAYVDLSKADAREQIERHLATSALVCGIRDLRYDNYLSDERWVAGYSLLAEYGLVCCDDPFLHEISMVVDLARRHPDVVLCIDHALFPEHIGDPRERNRDAFEMWRNALRQLAAVENVTLKISGLGQCDHQWTVESIRPWVSSCIDAFGVDRIVLGTNWPVDRLYSSYGDVIDAYDRLLANCSGDEREAMFSLNAIRIFGLGTLHARSA